MNTLAVKTKLRLEQGYSLYSLTNEEVEIVVVPELGARIISLKNMRTGREWLWHPRGGLKLFGNRAGDNFSDSPLAGIDECFPTISPCIWRGRSLPDHGELWSAAWQTDNVAWENGSLHTRLNLRISPFQFERKIQLEGNTIRLNYTLANLGETDEQYLWAFHPLLRLQLHDQLDLPESTRRQLNGTTWVDAIDVAVPEAKCAKVFAAPVSEGWAAVSNPQTGDRLEFSWNSDENNTLGLWLTRGGWHGHDHFSVEPANADHDSLVTAAERKCCGTIAAQSTAGWQICLRIGS